jgi:Family of unknown function (DUF6524)
MTDNNDISANGFNALGFLWRFLAALVLVLVTFNPSGHSAWHWTVSAIGSSSFGPLNLLLLALLLIGWVIFWVATWRALGTLGVVLAGLLLGALIWLLFDIGLLKSHSLSAITWIALVCLAFVLALGVSWSHVWRRFTGQINVEDVDD